MNKSGEFDAGLEEYGKSLILDELLEELELNPIPIAGDVEEEVTDVVVGVTVEENDI